jgi:hypothetical protein
LRFGEKHRRDQCKQNKYELNHKENWNHLMQGTHFFLPLFGLGAFNLAARSRFLPRSYVLSAGAQSFMNVS